MAFNLLRTSEELNDLQYNYFAAFKLDITETDPNVIERVVKTTLSSPSGNIRLRRLIELKNDILEIMCNDAVFDGTSYVPQAGGRKQEAARAVELKLKEAVELVQNICSVSGRQTLEYSELETIQKGAKGYFTVAELKKRIEALPQGIRVTSAAQRAMLFTEYSRIEDYLAIVRKKDLYDFLGVSDTASTAEIAAAVNGIYSGAMRTGDLRLKQGVSGLGMLAKKLLLNEDSQYRTYYDYYLKLNDSVWKMLALRRTYGIKALSPDEYKGFVQIIVNAISVDGAEAEMILAAGCKYYHISVD